MWARKPKQDKTSSKRAVYTVHEYIEPAFNAVMTTKVVNQRFLRTTYPEMDRYHIFF